MASLCPSVLGTMRRTNAISPLEELWRPKFIYLRGTSQPDGTEELWYKLIITPLVKDAVRVP